MSKNEPREGGAAALEAMSRKVVEEVTPKLERLRAAKGSAREMRADVAELNETVEGLAEEVAKVRLAVKAARKRRAAANVGGEG